MRKNDPLDEVILPARKRRAVVLLSGGIDSMLTAAIASYRDGFELHAITVRYGQVGTADLAAARAVGEYLPVSDHVFASAPLSELSLSPFTGYGQMPTSRPLETIARTMSTAYVPTRNLLFMALATAHAERVGATRLYTGLGRFHAEHYPGVSDKFMEAWAGVCAHGTMIGLQGREFAIVSPMSEFYKPDIICMACDLGLDLSITRSCYLQTTGRPCGECDGCIIRRESFKAAGVTDTAPLPITYGEHRPTVEAVQKPAKRPPPSWRPPVLFPVRLPPGDEITGGNSRNNY